MKTVLAEAVDWYVRLNDSAANDITRSEWHAWVTAKTQHAEAWARIQHLQQRMGKAPSELASITLEQARQQRRMTIKVLVLLLGAGAVSWQGYRASPLSADYATRVGERRRLTLPDGSQLDLNTNTRVDILFDATQRLVHLRQGEILIQTAKDSRPLSVQTAEGRIKALGTRFSVRQHSGQSQVIVSEQAVAVNLLLAPKQRVHVESGYSLNFTAEQFGIISAVTPDALAWTQGMLVTVDWRLEDVVAELARYRAGFLGCSKQVADLRLSGAFNLDDSNLALHSLRDALPVKIRQITRYWVRLEHRDA